MAATLLAILQEVLLPVFVEAGIGKLKGWWREPPAGRAVRRTAAKFPQYPALDDSLKNWMSRPRVETILDGLSEGHPPNEKGVEDLIHELGEVGFVPLPSSPAPPEILAELFQTYVEEQLGEEGTRFTTTVLSLKMDQTKDHVLEGVTRIVEEGIGRLESRVPVLLVRGEPALLPAGVSTPGGQSIEDAKALLASGRAQAALELLRVRQVKQDDHTQLAEAYELMATRGNAFLQLERYSEAEESFRAALELKPSRPNALANVGLVLLLRGDAQGALSQVERALALEPGNEAALRMQAQVLIQLGRPQEASEVAQKLKNSTAQDHLIGWAALRAGNLDDAVAHFENAHLADSENAGITVDLAHALLLRTQDGIRSVDHAPWGNVPESALEALKRARGLLDDAIQQLDKRDPGMPLRSALVDRAKLKAFLGEESADEDFSRAVDLAAMNAELVLEASRYWIPHGMATKAELTIAKIRKREVYDPELELAYAQALLGLGRSDEALVVLQDNRLSNSEFARAAILGRIDVLLRKGELDGAEAELQGIDEKERRHWDVAVRATEIQSERGKKSEALLILRSALEQAKPDDAWRLKLLIAQRLGYDEQWEESARLFGEVLRPNAPPNLLYQYVVSLLNAGEVEASLRIARQFREGRGISANIASVEAGTLASLGRLGESDELYAILAKMEPTNPRWRLERAAIAYRRGDSAGALALLPSPAEVQILGWRQGMDAALVLANVGEAYRALETAYQVLRRHRTDAGAHMTYVGVFLAVDTIADDMLHPMKVGPGTWVTLESDGVRKVYEIVDELEEPQPPFSHRPTHGLGAKLNERQVGDEVVLRDDYLGRDTVRVVEVRSKYVGLFQETIQNYPHAFPDDEGLRSLKIGGAADFEPLRRSLAERSMRIKDMVGQYNQLPIPISTLARMLGLDDIEAWGLLISGEVGGPFVADGSLEAQQEYAAVAEKASPLVLELSSVAASRELGHLELLPKLDRPLLVAQAVIDDLESIRAERAIRARRGPSMSVFERGGQFYRENLSADDVARQESLIADLIRWIRDRCDVRGISPASGKSLQILAKMLSPGAFGSLVLAGNTGGALISEDLRLRALGRGEFRVRGAASFHLLAELARRDVISRDDCQDAIARVVTWGYRFVSISHLTLLRALRLDGMAVGRFLSSVLSQLGDATTDEDPVLNIAAEFIRELMLLALPVWRRQLVLQSVFESLSKRGGWRRLEPLLGMRLRGRLQLHPLALQQVLLAFEAWKRGKLSD